MTTVGAYEAKTHLPRLLSEVAKGETVTITRHGSPVARIVPVHAVGDAGSLFEDFVAARKGARRGDDAVADMIAEGRR